MQPGQVLLEPLLWEAKAMGRVQQLVRGKVQLEQVQQQVQLAWEQVRLLLRERERGLLLQG